MECRKGNQPLPTVAFDKIPFCTSCPREALHTTAILFKEVHLRLNYLEIRTAQLGPKSTYLLMRCCGKQMLFRPTSATDEKRSAARGRWRDLLSLAGGWMGVIGGAMVVGRYIVAQSERAADATLATDAENVQNESARWTIKTSPQSLVSHRRCRDGNEDVGESLLTLILQQGFARGSIPGAVCRRMRRLHDIVHCNHSEFKTTTTSRVDHLSLDCRSIAVEHRSLLHRGSIHHLVMSAGSGFVALRSPVQQSSRSAPKTSSQWI